MKKLVLALLMCCSSMAYGQTTVQQPVTETTHQMGDDGFIQVTIPFTFRYYGIETTNSWMYDNGIISFLQPGTPGAVSPWQWNAVPFNQTNSNYYIASLWADIAPVSITKYITQTDGTYMKYIWQDIAEYYSVYGNWRLNTFSTTLKDDGTIETHYTKINLQTSAIGVGTVGDSAAGEINQIYYSPCCVTTTTGMIPDWTKAGPPLPPPPPEPVVVQPEVYVAPQTVEEPVTETVAVAATTVVNEPETIVVTTTPTTTTTVVTTTLVQAATESSPASVTTASIAATTSSTTNDSSSNKMSVADAQSIARTNQKNAAQLVTTIVNNSIESSTMQTVTTDNDTISNSDMVVTSTTNTSSSSNNTTNVVIQSNNSSVADTGNNNALTTSSSVNLASFARLPGAFIIDGSNEVNESRITSTAEISTDTITQETKLTNNNNTETLNAITDEVNPTSVRSLAANNIPTKQVEEEQEKKNVEIADMNKDSSVSELASFGVRLTELQVLPIGYNIYLAAILKDSPFYAPKAIYRNQTVVDNAPAQRLLKFASDIKFDQMVSQQYGEQ